MKIFLRSSISEKSILDKIETTLKEEGHLVDLSIIDTKTKDEHSSVEEKNISKYDLLVVEISKPNAQLGSEVSYAMQENIPVVLLYIESKSDLVFPLISSNPKSKVVKKAYKIDQLENDIKNVLKEISSYTSGHLAMDLSPHISEFLDWVSIKNNTTRAVYVRSLIEAALKKNTDYKAYLKKG